jgi:hypothetical protein
MGQYMNQPSERSNRDYQKVYISGRKNKVFFTQSGDIPIHDPKLLSGPDSQRQNKRVYENIGRRGITSEQFKGREAELDRLHQLLTSHVKVGITAAVTGMGGVGKTELAIQYARKHKNLNTYISVVWLPARDFAMELVEFARCNFPQITIPDGVSSENKVNTCWQGWVEGEVLLVIDDVTDYDKEIKPYLPADARFKVLLTSRLKFKSPIESLDLEILQEDEALALLEFFIGQKKIQAELECAKKICDWLGYLPLGLELIGKYIVDTNLSLVEMLEELQAIRLKHPALEQANHDGMTGELG